MISDEKSFESKISSNRLLVLYEISKAINSILDLDRLLEKVVDLAIQEVKAERGLILLLNEDTEVFDIKVARNLEKSTIDDATQYSKNIVKEAGKGKVILSYDACHDERFKDFSSVVLNNIRSLICVPLTARDKIIGTVYVDCRNMDNRFNEEDLNFLQAFAHQAAIAVENAKLYELATVDELTRLYMKHHFDKLMQDELKIATKYRLPVTLLLIDIDNFKNINDERGHIIGDQVLARIGNVIKTTISNSGIGGRYGGDEFIILLPRCTIEESLQVAGNLRKTVEEVHVTDLLGDQQKLSISVGVSTFPNYSAEMLIQKADDALYQAKQDGRNCVRIA